MWCMWLSDLGSGFGKIVKCQTDLQKKCQMELHNDRAKSQKSFIYKGFRDFIFVRDATVMLMGRKCLIFGDFLLLYDTVRFIRFYLPHYHLWLLLH